MAQPSWTRDGYPLEVGMVVAFKNDGFWSDGWTVKTVDEDEPLVEIVHKDTGEQHVCFPEDLVASLN